MYVSRYVCLPILANRDTDGYRAPKTKPCTSAASSATIARFGSLLTRVVGVGSLSTLARFGSLLTRVVGVGSLSTLARFGSLFLSTPNQGLRAVAWSTFPFHTESGAQSSGLVDISFPHRIRGSEQWLGRHFIA
jgi:hypothetical protein